MDEAKKQYLIDSLFKKDSRWIDNLWENGYYYQPGRTKPFIEMTKKEVLWRLNGYEGCTTLNTSHALYPYFLLRIELTDEEWDMIKMQLILMREI